MAQFTPTSIRSGRSTNGDLPIEKSGAIRQEGSHQRRRRNPPLVALGVLLVVGCAIGFSSAWLRAEGRQEVLVVSNGVSIGHILTSGDLRTAQMSIGSGVASVPASDAGAMVGRTVTMSLVAGSLLTPSDVTEFPGPPGGRAVVGLALKPGQFPPNIETGERVLVVFDNGSASSTGTLGATDSSGSAPTTAPVEATVVELEQAPANGDEAVVASVQLAEGNGASVATAASAGDVSLAVVSSGSRS